MPTILIIDDEQENLELFAYILKRAGHQVETCTNAHDAMTLISHAVPDIFIVDLHLPHIDGFEVIDMLRQHAETCQTPILILTSDDSVQSQVKAEAVGGDAYLIKPVNPHQLADMVDALLVSQ